METSASLIKQVADERARLIDLVAGLSSEQASYKPTPETWSVNEKLEHLVLAEVSGVSKIWSAAEGVRSGKPVWVGEHTNRGSSIEQVIARTWKPREIAPPIATPHIGGPLSYWLEYLRTAQQLLNRLEPILAGLDLESILFPHFISGPLDAGQRIAFLRFHMMRHRVQIESMLTQKDFPGSSSHHPVQAIRNISFGDEGRDDGIAFENAARAPVTDLHDNDAGQTIPLSPSRITKES